VLKLRVELDPNQPQVPDHHLSQVRHRKHKWSGRYYKLDGKLYKEVRAMTCPATATYRCKKEYRRFVALVGLDERVEASDSVVFEVFADKRRLYTSPPVTKRATPVGIYVRVPTGTKEVKLTTRGADFNRRSRAYWANAGFLLKGEDTRVGFVRLFVPGYDRSRYKIAVYTLNGYRVASELLPTQEAGVVDVLFYGHYNYSVYYAYLVPKDKYEPPPREWKPDAGLVLRTRYTSTDAKACAELAGFRRVWQKATPIGAGLVAGVHHGHPVHPEIIGSAEASSHERMALYWYTGFFETEEAGDYLFATASHWGSYLLVDDELVVGWPGKHDYRAGWRGQKRKKIPLEPGVHRLDYLNYSPRGNMLTMAAWKSPGGRFGLMTRCDFPAVQGYVVTGAETRTPQQGEPQRVSFDWRVVDDWRLDRDKEALIRVTLRAIPQPGTEELACRWQFDDGVTATGPRVERVYFASGERRVTVELLDGEAVRGQTSQSFHVGPLADKIWVEPRDRPAFERVVSRLSLRSLPVRDVVTLYKLAVGIHHPEWQEWAADTLLARSSEWVGRKDFHHVALALVEHLRGAKRKQYPEALRVCVALHDAANEGTAVRQRAKIVRAELLLHCFGSAREALELLKRAGWERNADKQTAQRLGMAQAEALIGVGQIEEARKVLRDLGQETGDSEIMRRAIRHAGLVRRASQLVHDQGEPVQLDHAMVMLETVLREEPEMLLSPRLNLVRLDVYLGRGEHRIARHLAERLADLEMAAYDRAQLLVRHVKALCGLGDVDQATDVCRRLAQLCPQSSELLEARTALTQIRTAIRGQ
jgi:hypothetical protein